MVKRPKVRFDWDKIPTEKVQYLYDDCDTEVVYSIAGDKYKFVSIWKECVKDMMCTAGIAHRVTVSPLRS